MRQYYNPRTGKIEYDLTPEKGEVGSPGPQGLKGDKGDTVIGPIGPAGINGKNGLNGKDGDRGSKWFYGRGVPEKIDGSKKNDMYLDLDTGDVYAID